MGQHGHRQAVIREMGRASRHLSRRVDSRMGNDGTEDGTAQTDVVTGAVCVEDNNQAQSR